MPPLRAILCVPLQLNGGGGGGGASSRRDGSMAFTAGGGRRASMQWKGTSSGGLAPRPVLKTPANVLVNEARAARAVARIRTYAVVASTEARVVE
eukprot:2834325-Pleurochrysis_carterae.AAC.1